APPVAVSLPSRSSYFLLDDFNHHHQHAVLAGDSHRQVMTREWASTHRVLKGEGHTLDFIVRRCNTVLKDAHRRTLKQWRAEQLVLTELEFEWIRQFYIQGRTHYDLHLWWHKPLSDLIGFWVRLEVKTHAVLAALRGAAEASSDISGNQCHGRRNLPPLPSRAEDMVRKEKKARQKRTKNLEAVRAVGGEAAFTMMEDALFERAEKRRMWKEREEDKV
ncbi:unnamed protein product, partial [Choristocarpus tenellus]